MALLLACAGVQAEIKLADATVCDVEQGRAEKPDNWMSWAAADANLIQAWQDVYYSRHDEGETPPTGSGTGMARSAEVYRAFLDGWNVDGYSYIPNGVTWWFQGGEYQLPFGAITASVTEPAVHAERDSGYYNTVFGPTVISEDVTDRGATPCFNDVKYYGTDLAVHTGSTEGRQVSYAELKAGLDQAFQYKGHAAALGIYCHSSVLSATTMHALTCWGYETDGDGKVLALYVTDSADGRTGMVKMGVTSNGKDEEGKELLYLVPEDAKGIYSLGAFCIKSVTGIATPQEVAVEAEDRSILPAGGTLTGNTGLNADTTVHQTVTVGEWLLLAAAQGVQLTIDNAEGNGLVVEATGAAQLHGTGIQGCSGSGLLVTGNVEVDGQELVVSQNRDSGLAVSGSLQVREAVTTITGNSTAQDGGGIRIAFGGSMTVNAEDSLPALVVSRNTSGGNGGGVCNAGSLVISDIGSVTMEGNSAQQGSAIYNSGNLSIYGIWNGVTISAPQGSTAAVVYNAAGASLELAEGYAQTTIGGAPTGIENHGTLFLGAYEETPIVFQDCALSGSGTAYLGMDALQGLYFGQGVVFTQGDSSTAVGSSVDDDTAILHAASLAAGSLAGLNENARLTHAFITADAGFNAENIQLDAVVMQAAGSLLLHGVSTAVDSIFTAASITLQDATLSLVPAVETPLLLTSTLPPADGAEMVRDISGVFKTESLSGSLTLVQDDITRAMRDAGLSRLRVDFGEGVQLAQDISLHLQGLDYDGVAGSSAYFTLRIPEPSSPALALLAIAACAARRKTR